MRGVSVRILLALACSAGASAQTPAGPEFRVNAFTTSRQHESTVASDRSGRFVVVWQSYPQDGHGYGVFAQRFDAGGAPLGEEFQVNEFTTSHQARPAVAVDGGGNFIIVWESLGQDGSLSAVIGRRFDASGASRGGEFQANTFTSRQQFRPAVAASQRGDFVVVWSGDDQDGSGRGVFAQRFDVSGARLGGEFRVNVFTTGTQTDPAVASDPDGNFLVAWSSFVQFGGADDIVIRRFDRSGAPTGPEFAASTPPNNEGKATVSGDARGQFVVAWESLMRRGVFARRVDASGTPLGMEFQVAADTGPDFYPRVASSATGDFVVAWERLSTVGADSFAQRFTASGERRGAQFRLNSHDFSGQFSPAVGSDPSGNLVATWTSHLQDGSDLGIYGQRYGGLLPVALEVDGAGNRVLEPGETVEAAPSWRNLNGTELTFTGAASPIAGPSGGTYTLADDTADYGRVAGGATGACGASCYRLSVTAAARPLPHWDATFVETILPDSLGLTRRWTLHLGGSFTDVERGSPFYRFVETLLHHSVTGGCSSTLYCPGASLARQQLAVFVLAAREGSRFQPPACTAPLFSDVPPDSGFCPWIEELARRGVLGGCGGGRFCPADPVTRDEMAVAIMKAIDPTAAPPPCTRPAFVDVPADHPACPGIEELARRGVVAGCGQGRYCPAEATTRAQMAVFVSAAFGLSLYGPF
jgi:hypothetical protein